MTTEGYGADVVVLLHGIFFSIEVGIDEAIAFHQFFLARCQCHVLPSFIRVRIVGTYIHPVFVALRRELILQFNMVEVAEVHVEAVNMYG